MLLCILRLSGVWTTQLDEQYEPLQHEESDVPRSLSPEEQDIFLKTAKQMYEFLYCFAILGIDATLSTVEERSLKIGDINIANGIILIRSASAKNKYRIRTIPLTSEAKWAVERLLERAADLGATSPQHYLFPFRIVNGTFDPDRPMTVSGVKYQWNQIRIAAGLPWFTPYGLRHTGCTRYAESGMAIDILLSMAGHMSRKMQQHYIHISEAAKRKAVEFASRYRSIASGAKKSPESASRGTTVLTPGKKLV